MGLECIKMPLRRFLRLCRTRSMPKENNSMANLSPCRTDILLLAMHLPRMLYTIDRLSVYRLRYWSITWASRPFLSSTLKHHVDTMLQKAATRSVSRIPHSSLDLLAEVMASLAKAIPWEILLSYSHHCAILHTFSFILYFIPNSLLNSEGI